MGTDWWVAWPQTTGAWLRNSENENRYQKALVDLPGRGRLEVQPTTQPPARILLSPLTFSELLSHPHSTILILLTTMHSESHSSDPGHTPAAIK